MNGGAGMEGREQKGGADGTSVQSARPAPPLSVNTDE